MGVDVIEGIVPKNERQEKLRKTKNDAILGFIHKNHDMNLTHLNPAQKDAVTVKNKHVFVLAGAGTGKTSVLTHRIAWLLDQGVDLHNVLAVTFTNKAAKEMKDRLGRMLEVPIKDAWIGTFHGVCLRLLRENHELAKLNPRFTVMDEADQLSLVKRIMLTVDEPIDKESVDPVLAFIKHYKDKGIRSKDLKFEPNDRLNDDLKYFYFRYEEWCEMESVVDFAELILKVVEMLRDHPEFRAKMHKRFKHVLVDEFQDTSILQYEWMKLMVGPKAFAFAVGDDDQSIYSWRGAVVKNVNSFIQEYDAKVVKLEENYRSTAPILKLANEAIDLNTGRLGKTLTATKPGKELPLLWGAVDHDEEADNARNQIKKLHASGVPYKEMAVLYRANALSRAFEHALSKSGIPYKVFGGLRFYERQEVKHALAYLKLLAAPEDNGAFSRVINIPPRGVGAQTLEELTYKAYDVYIPMFDMIKDDMDLKIQSKKAIQALKDFKKMIVELRETQHDGSPVADRLKNLLDRTGLKAWYEELVAAKKEPQERLDNLEELVNAARGFEKEFPNATLEDFLSTTTLEPAQNKPDKEGENDYVSLMTIHAAKGLEFASVFVAGVEEGVLPNPRCLDDAELEEERRLFYVAITRAKAWLTLSTCANRMKYGDTKEVDPSRFLTELPLKTLIKYEGPPKIKKELKLR
jgi:DNA helicase-2/ATP-dependent DNA helicase PcrA